MSSSTYVRLAAVGVLLLAACTSTHRTSAVSEQRLPPSPSTSPVTRPQSCGSAGRAFWLPGPDNSKLEAMTFGSGRAAAVFLHEAGVGADMCGFWPFARWLAMHRQVRVVLFNRCTYGRSTCDVFQTGDDGIVTQVQPAVDWARRHGARRITLVGASSGASDALQAAGVVHDVAAIVDLSGDNSADTGANDLTDARRVHIPALFAVAPGDRYASVSRVRAVYRAVPTNRKRLVIVRSAPGTHGWDLLHSYHARAFTPLARLVAEWVVGQRP
jgi:hypothetical protein